MKSCVKCDRRYPDPEPRCPIDGGQLVPVVDPRIGMLVGGRYRLDALIGEGGMAGVYRAHHVRVERPCAVKILALHLARDPVVLERFRREAKATKKLAHPNIVDILDEGDTPDGSAYIAMELLEGDTLHDVIRRGPLPLERGLGVMIQMARGIARAHDLEVVHRDLKPENVFVAQRGDGTDLVKILDFGIARSRADARLTGRGELFGTPQYMAPERVTNSDPGAGVDLYALGVVYFEMMTGRLPIEANDVMGYLVKHVREPPKRPRDLRADLPLALEDLILRLLAKAPSDRPVDAHRVEQELAALATSLGFGLPVEPENDPASVRMAAPTMPSITIDSWHARLNVFEQMLLRVEDDGPPELGDLLLEITAAVSKAAQIKRAIVGEQQRVEDLQGEAREGRQRFGNAVDALGVDLSRAREALRLTDIQVSALDRAVEHARSRFHEWYQQVKAWEAHTQTAGQVTRPSRELALAFRSAAEGLDAWQRADDASSAVRAEREVRARDVSDLDFQILELRNALAQHERNLDGRLAEADATIGRFTAEAESVETGLDRLSSRFCAPLRGRAELAPLLAMVDSASDAPS